MTHAGQIADSPDEKKQEASAILLRDEIQQRDLAQPVATRVSKVLRLVSKFSLHRVCLRCVMRHGLLAPGKPLAFCAFFAMVCIRNNDFTLRARNEDVWMNPILCQTVTNASPVQLFASDGGTLQFCRGSTIFSTTW